MWKYRAQARDALHDYLEEAEIGAYVDTRSRPGREFSQKYGAPAFSSVGEMMKRWETRLTSSACSRRAARTARTCSISSSTAAALIQKPMAPRLEDADRMIDACDAHGVKLFVVHQNRYNLPIIKAREALAQGRFGRLVMGTVQLRWTRDQASCDFGTLAQDLGARRWCVHEPGGASH